MFSHSYVRCTYVFTLFTFCATVSHIYSHKKVGWTFWYFSFLHGRCTVPLLSLLIFRVECLPWRPLWNQFERGRERERERACSYSSLRVLTPSRARTAMVRSQILCWLKNVVKGCVIKTATNATFDHIYLVSIVHISTVAVGFQNMYTELCKGMYVFKFYGIMRPCSRTACQKTANQLLAEDNGPILATLGPSRSRPCSS